MIFEALIASSDVVIDGVPLLPEAIVAELPLPLLREHNGAPVGEVYHLQRTAMGLVAHCETREPVANFTHVSPSVRVHSAQRMALIEVSVVKNSKSPNTKILQRREHDPLRDYIKTRREGDDLLIKAFQLLQQACGELLRMIRAIPEQQAAPQQPQHPLANLPMLRG